MPRGWSLAMLVCAALAPAALVGACTKDVPGPAVCSQRQLCEGGQSCVLGRCRVEGTMPVSFDAPRHSFVPVRLALLAAGEVRQGEALGPAIRLGERGAPQTLLLGFALQLPESAAVQRALLEFSPLPSCPYVPNRLRLELMQIEQPWEPDRLRATALPALSLPMRYAPQTVQERPLRVDVTELVRAWQQRTSSDYGIALNVAGDGDQASCFSSGRQSGQGPRLDVYLWPPRDAGSDAADAGDADQDGGDAGDAGRDAGHTVPDGWERSSHD